MLRALVQQKARAATACVAAPTVADAAPRKATNVSVEVNATVLATKQQSASAFVLQESLESDSNDRLNKAEQSLSDVI